MKLLIGGLRLANWSNTNDQNEVAVLMVHTGTFPEMPKHV